MSFIAALLKSIDGFWALLTIPAILVGAMFFVFYLPIPTLIVALLFIRMQFELAEVFVRSAALSDEPAQYVKSRFNFLAKACLLILATLVSFGWSIHGTIVRGGLCEDYSDYIPATLPALLQKIVPHSC